MEATPPTVRLAVGLHRLSEALGRSVWSVQLTPPPSTPALAGVEADKRVCAAVTLEPASPKGVSGETIGLEIVVAAPGTKALALAVETLLAGLELAAHRAGAAALRLAATAASGPASATAEAPQEPEPVQRARSSVPAPRARPAPVPSPAVAAAVDPDDRPQAAAPVPPPPPAPGELYPPGPVDPSDDGAPF